MLSQRNPYNWQRINPELFYGRTDLADKLVHRLAQGESFGITGGRRMGKTTLLRRVEKDLFSYAHKVKEGGFLVLPVYIETLALPERFSAEAVYQTIASLVAKQIHHIAELPVIDYEQVNVTNFTTYLKSVVNAITEYYLPQFIFLFDEIEPIVKSDWGRVFFDNWRSLLHNTPDLDKYTTALFSGASEMVEIARDIGSPLGNVLTWRELRLFSRDDTAKLMREPSQYDWPDHFVEAVCDLTGGHPFLVQYMMQIVCSDEIEKASQSLEKAKVQFLDEQKMQFQNWWSRFNNTTRAIYANLAEQGSVSRKAILSGFGDSAYRNLPILEHTGVIRLDEKSDMITTAGTLFKEWFNRFGDLKITPTLADQVDSLLKDVERRLRQLLTDHIGKKYKPSWLRKRVKNDQIVWQRILDKTKGLSETELTNEKILKSLDIGYLFDIILLGTEWNEFNSLFSNLSLDPKKAKLRLEERKDHLVFVRNKLRHVNEDELIIGDLLKAQAFCAELLEFLP